MESAEEKVSFIFNYGDFNLKIKKEIFFSIEDAKELDKKNIQNYKIASQSLMEMAGSAMANWLITTFNLSNFTLSNQLLLIGKGNNGGDAWVISRIFFSLNIPQTIIFLESSTKKMSQDNKKQFKLFLQMLELNLKEIEELEKGKKITKKNTELFFIFPQKITKLAKILSHKKPKIIIEGIYGSGMRYLLSSSDIALIQIINSYKKKQNKKEVKFIAIDIPLAFFSETDIEKTIIADYTLTVQYPKDVFYYPWYRYRLGYIVPIVLPFIPNPSFHHFIYNKIQNNNTMSFCLEPSKDIIKTKNKNYLGRSLIIAGSADYPGAIELSVRAAVKNGVRYLYSLGPSFVQPPPVLVSRKIKKTVITKADYLSHAKDFSQVKNILIGPGLSRNSILKDLFLEFYSSLRGKRIIIDADGIYHLKNTLTSKNIKSFFRKNKVLITPHLDELVYFSGIEKSELKYRLFFYLEQIRKEYAIDILVKDSGMLLFSQNYWCFDKLIPYLGKAGSGDILSGYLLASINELEDFETAVVCACFAYQQQADEIQNKYGTNAPLSKMYN